MLVMTTEKNKFVSPKIPNRRIILKRMSGNEM
jgi:hypothetical protein